jgi:hypothetical protein
VAQAHLDDARAGSPRLFFQCGALTNPVHDDDRRRVITAYFRSRATLGVRYFCRETDPFQTGESSRTTEGWGFLRRLRFRLGALLMMAGPLARFGLCQSGRLSQRAFRAKKRGALTCAPHQARECPQKSAFGDVLCCEISRFDVDSSRSYAKLVFDFSLLRCFSPSTFVRHLRDYGGQTPEIRGHSCSPATGGPVRGQLRLRGSVAGQRAASKPVVAICQTSMRMSPHR